MASRHSASTNCPRAHRRNKEPLISGFRISFMVKNSDHASRTDDVLRRMLSTPPDPKKGKAKKPAKKKPAK